MRLEHYRNNAYDSVLLIEDECVVGAWPSDLSAVSDFYAAEGGDLLDWHTNDDEWRPCAGIDELVATIDQDGKLTLVDVV